MHYYVSLFFGNPITHIVRLFCKIIKKDSRQTETWYQPSKSEQLEVNEELHPSATGKQTKSTVLPPFSGELRVDEELKLSNNDFKESIEEFYAAKQLSAIDQLEATPSYPKPQALAQFASMEYRDYKYGDPEPPEGWKFLTTASHCGIENGYFGTAYWHREHQQVVIAHRGTDISNVGALVTDVKGVLFNNYVEQMNSASTFANKVVTVLQEIEREQNVSFELFFTGHSLGGWLAQITTFTTEYLEVKGGTFLKKLETKQDEPITSNTVEDRHDIKQIYHPHTVVFDSPGCKDMLSQMADKLDVRLNGRSIDLQRLNISSYLSAPNLINTCNSHVGTVYRIFTDLSDTGFFGKHTPLYNVAMHKIKKIVQAFDPETGQVYKDNKGELKTREVVDWPVNTGLTGGAELNNFFEWAKHPNHYHPEVMDTVHSKVPKGYHPLRYQTKAYDECTSNLSIFNKDEREFLELYHSVRRMPELVNPQDIFSVINNAEAEKEAKRRLQNFKLESESVRCPDASTLHALIPYVKRLVRLFPHIKKKIEDQMSSPQIINSVYQCKTQRYVEKIRQSTLEFNPGTLRLGDFLTGGQQIWQLRMTDGDVWTGITKVYQVLQNTSCTPIYFSEGHYTILKLKRMLTVNRMLNLNARLSSMETPHLLMIACGKNQPVNDKLRDMFTELFSILKQKKTMKIILTTPSEGSTFAFLQQIAGEGMQITDEKVTQDDLTPNSQRKVLEKTVIFQGIRVILNRLISAQSLTDSFPLVDLLKEKELRIGEPVPSASSGYNEKYYIARTFNHNIFIRQDILSDKRAGKFADLLASTEQEFKQLCQQNSKENIHWLQKNESGELIWLQSQGKFKILRKYVDSHKSHTYAPGDLDKFLEQAKQQRVMLIADKAGMGKTTALIHLSKLIKQKYPAHWLVRIDLNEYTELLKVQKGKKMDKGWVLEFVSKEVLKLESYLEKELFKKSLEGNGVNKVVVMVDGFDEICPNHKETVLDMLQVLKQTSLEQLWVTTRPHLKEELEDTLQQLSYTLQPFPEDEQVDLLKEVWLQNLNPDNTDHNLLQIYATALIRKLAQSISDKDREFTGIPLQTRMIAEAFNEEFISFYRSEKTEPELPHKLDLLGLYIRFIDSKYDIYFREKSRTPAGNVVAEEQRERDLKSIQTEHQLLALQALFTEDQVAFLQIFDESSFSDEELARIGIVQRNNDGKLQFIHRTFVEYFVAEFLIKQLAKKTKPHPQVQEFLISKVLQRDCRVIRVFLNGLLEKSRPKEEALKQCGELLNEQWNETEVNGILVGFKTALHEAAAEDNAQIIGLLFESLKSVKHKNAITKLLLAKDHQERTAWHVAAENDSVQALKKIWEWAEEVTGWQVAEETVSLEINVNDLKDKFLLHTDKYGNTAWHWAVKGGSLEALQTLWSWAKEVKLKPHQLLIAKNKERKTAWQLAVEEENIKVLQKIWVWCKEVQLTPDEVKNELLLAKDNDGYTSWHQAAERSSIEILDTIWNWAKEAELKPRELLLARSGKGYTAWQMAAEEMQLQVLKKMWIWAKEVELNPGELKDKLLLAKDKYGYTAWHRAAEKGSLEALEAIWSWVKEAELNTDELLLAEGRRGRTAFQVAAEENHIETLKKLWAWAEEAQQNQNNIKKELFLAKDHYGYTAWHGAAKRGSLQALETLWSWAVEAGLNTDELLLSQNKEGNTAWKMAVQQLHLAVLKKLWEWEREAKLNPKESLNQLLLAKGRYGNTAWHQVARKGSLEALETLWGWAKEVEPNHEKLLLARNEEKENAWQIAMARCHFKLLQKLWVWAKEEKLQATELKNEMLLVKDKDGNTVWHRALKVSSSEDKECYDFFADIFALVPPHPSELPEFLQKLWDWAKDVQLQTTELKNNFLLAKNKYGETPFHLAAESGRLEALHLLWGWAKDVQLKPNELKNKLLLAKNKDGNTAFHLAVESGKLEALQIIWSWAKEVKLKPNYLKKNLLLAKNDYGNTAFHIAAESGRLEALQEIWSWAKEVKLQPNELKNKLMLAKNKYGNTALHLAAESGKLEALQILWIWAKEVQLTPNELKDKLLLAKNKDENTAFHLPAESRMLNALQTLRGWAKEVKLKLMPNKHGYTAWQLAAKSVHLEVLKKLWEWAKEAQLNPDELKDKLLLSKDRYGYTAWHRASAKGNLEALETLWSWAEKENLNPDDFRNKWLLAQNERGETAWNMAVLGNHEEVLKKLWVWAKEMKLDRNELRSKLLLATDQCGYTVWHRAAERGSLQALETLWIWAKDGGLNTVAMKNKLLLAKNKDGETAWDIAARNKNADVLEKLWGLAKEGKLNRKDLKNKLLLAKNSYGKTAWDRAAEAGSLKIHDTLWIMEENLFNKMEGKNLLPAQDAKSETAKDMATIGNPGEVLKKLWVRVKRMKLGRNELRNKLFLAIDPYGYSVWHLEAERGSLETLETLWSWAKRAGLNTGEIKKKLLLAKNEDGETAWDIAARNKNGDVLEKLWGFAKEVKMNRNELKNKLLLAKGSYGKTAWDRAAEAGSLKIPDTLWIMEEKWFKKMKRKNLLSAQDEESETAKDVAAIGNPDEVLKKLWVWAKEVNLKRNELRKLLLSKDRMGETVWHGAAESGSLEALETIWSWAKEVKLNPDKLFLATNVQGETARQLADKRGHKDVLEKLGVWEKEVQLN